MTELEDRDASDSEEEGDAESAGPGASLDDIDIDSDEEVISNPPICQPKWFHSRHKELSHDEFLDVLKCFLPVARSVRRRPAQARPQLGPGGDQEAAQDQQRGRPQSKAG